jgi:PRC-barrel domain protein
VWNDEDGMIGRLDGVVLDPESRRVQYLVVAAGGTFRRHRYLLPFPETRVDVQHHSFRVDARRSDLARCESFEPKAFHRFSDDDLMAYYFPNRPLARGRSETDALLQ